MEKHIEQFISAYIDDQLNDKERVMVEEHLKICQHCRHLVEDFKRLQSQVFVAYQWVEVPKNIEEKVMSKIKLHGHTTLSIIIPSMKMAISLLFILFIGSLGAIGFGLFAPIFPILLSVVQVVPILIASIPSLFIGIILFAIILLIISLLSLKNLLITKKYL
jgi:hypothetical protein